MLTNTQISRVSQDDWDYAAVQNFFPKALYEKITAGLDQLVWTEARQRFYKQREVNLKGNRYYESIFTEDVRSAISDSVGLFFGEKLETDFDISAHKMVLGDYIDVHTDANKHGETHRMTITLNNEWSASDGGVLLSLKNSSISSVRDAWLPAANNGFIFKITDNSYHAVSPITGSRERFSIILTFKSSGKKAISNQQTWIPYVMQGDIDCATSTAKYMGIATVTFSGSYKFKKFNSTNDFSNYVGNNLKNSPVQWSYKSGTSVNVDEHGQQSKGSDKARIEAISNLRRIPPIVIVKRKDKSFCLVDGSHRLSYANDNELPLGVAIFKEQIHF